MTPGAEPLDPATLDLSDGNVSGKHPRMRMGPAIAVYVWQYPLRFVHWGLVISIGVLSFTGYYIHNPFIIGQLQHPFMMGWFRFVHMAFGMFFLALFLLYTVLGCLVESIGMIVITVPLLFPVLAQYGIDPIWFGVILVMYVELGQISPPIGINLFVIQSIWNGKLSDVVMGTIPFHVIMFGLLFLLTLFPQLALWLPAHMN